MLKLNKLLYWEYPVKCGEAKGIKDIQHVLYPQPTIFAFSLNKKTVKQLNICWGTK